MTIFQAILLGIVEGITEYLPISSTGHLIITQSILGLSTDENKAAVDAFLIVIQGGAILAVLGLYRRRVMEMIAGVFGRNPAGLRLAIYLVIAFIPAAVLGVLFDDLISEYLFGIWPVLIALAVGGVWMIWIDWRFRWKGDPDPSGSDEPSSASESTAREFGSLTIEDMTPIKALLIGLLQCVAMWPGTSRSMMTIAGGTMLGLKPGAAAEFSFLLGLPTLGGACVYKLLQNLKDSAEAGEPNMFEVLGFLPVLIGIAVATVSAALAVRWLVAFLKRHGLTVFGFYRLILTAVLLVLVLTELIRVS